MSSNNPQVKLQNIRSTYVVETSSTGTIQRTEPEAETSTSAAGRAVALALCAVLSASEVYLNEAVPAWRAVAEHATDAAAPVDVDTDVAPDHMVNAPAEDALVLSARDADRVLSLLDEPPNPTPALLALFRRA